MQGLLSPDGFVPRESCGNWSPMLIAVHRVSDLLIFAAYVAIPLLVLWRAKRGLSFVPRDPVGLGLLIGFIASCGLTHVSNQMMFVWPVYRLDALVKAVCAAFSLASTAWFAYVGPRR